MPEKVCIPFAKLNNVTFTGAHEWRYPLLQRESAYSKHSMLLGFIHDGRLRVRELLTHAAKPERCAEVYRALREPNEDYLGVIFDWT